MTDVATPAATVPDPICVVPSKKVTVPVGAVAEYEIVAVKVTGFNKKAGLGDPFSVIVGVAGTTVRVTVAVPVV